MTQTKLLQKVKTLEREISEIKKFLGFGISREDLDLKNWEKIKKVARKIRKNLFKEKYPQLYVKIQERE